MKPLFLALAVMVVIAIGSAVILIGLDTAFDGTRTASSVRLN
ncbi:MAG: hypothetical protein V3T02_08405 [Alphaproteobacteria bacterium]